MKRSYLLLWLLLPILLAALILPPISYYVFRASATRQAYAQAQTDLEALQTNVSALASEMLPETTSSDGNRIQPFLRSASQTISETNGNARLLLYADENVLIYPREEDRAGTEAIDRAVVQLLGQTQNDTILKLKAEDGTYFISISASPVKTKRLTYLVTYCPISGIGTWVDDAGRIVLLLSFGVSCLLALTVFLVGKKLTGSLQRIEQAAEKISQRKYVTIQKPFPTKELESLRGSVNTMSAQLKSADRAEKTFFQNISHELRTPLMSIGGYAQGIEQGVFTNEKAAARVILSESERMTELVNSLLSLSRMERSDEPPVFTAVSIRSAVQSAADRVMGAAMQKGVSVDWGNTVPDIVINTDEKRLALILDNLLSNAIRYANKTVCIRADSSPKTVTLSIQDDGDGIAEMDLPHIFERGYIGKGGKSGIGLALAQAAAKSVGVKLTAQSKDTGAVFMLLIPTKN